MRLLPGHADVFMKKIILWAAAAFFVRTAGAEIPAATIRTPSGTVWRLVWNDEFDYTGLPDPARWNYDTSGNDCGWGNNELQHYTVGRRKNVGVKDGLLTVTARREPQGGKQYTSARLVTRGLHTWRYGRFEARVRFPEGRGTWSAVWLMPAESRYGEWPASGEIDLVEQVGYDSECIVGTVHTTRHSHLDGTQKSGNVRSPDVTRNFHRYAIEWEADELRFYFDEQLYFTYVNDGTGPESWPFDQPFYLILNLAVGGNWGGQRGIDDGVFPQRMEVDYVRVYEKAEAE